MKENKAIRQIIRLSLAFLILFYFQSCRKSKDGPFAPTPSYYNDEITYTDAVGFNYGGIDSTDWNTTDIFSPAISALFSFNDTINYNNADTSTITVYHAYPNPVIHQLSLNFVLNSTQHTVIKFVIVDSIQSVRFSGTRTIMPGFNTLAFNFNHPSLPSKSIYRMFYRFYYAPNQYYKSGHGDILKF